MIRARFHSSRRGARVRFAFVLPLGALVSSVLFVSGAWAHEGPEEGAEAPPGAAPGKPESEKEVTVVVHGTLPEATTASATVVTAREMAAVPRRTAEDGLRLVPGITLVQHGGEGKGMQFFVRGFDAVHGSDFEITLEGIPLNEWSNIHAQGYLDLGIIIPEAVESIRVTKGPFQLDQGAFAMAGSADYHVGVAPSSRGTSLAYTVGTTNRHRAVMLHSFEESSGHDFIASETLYDQGFGENRSVGRGALMARRTLYSSEGEELSFLGAAQVASFGLPTPLRNEDVDAGRVGFWDSYDERTRGQAARGLWGLSYEKESDGGKLAATVFGGYRKLELLENFTGFLRDPLNGDRRAQRQSAWNFGVRSNYHGALAPRLAWSLGLGLRGEVILQSQHHVGRNEEYLESERDLSGVQALGHASLGFTLRPLDSVRLDAGARADLAHLAAQDNLVRQTGSGTLVAVSPRGIIEWRVAQPVRLFGAYGRGFRPPELRAFSGFEPETLGLTEQLYQGGEPRMTVADSFEVGARLSPHRTVTASVSGFATMIQAENVFDHVSGTNVELNATRRLGTEIAVRYRPKEWLLVAADTTYVDARFVESRSLVPFAPRLVGGLRSVVTSSNGWVGGVRFFAVAPRPLPHGVTGGTWTQLDATAGRHFETWRIDLEVENLLGQRIRQGEYHFTSHWERGAPASNLPSLHYFAGPPMNARLTVSADF
jgi:iron complex outermembrane receptor protein